MSESVMMLLSRVAKGRLGGTRFGQQSRPFLHWLRVFALSIDHVNGVLDFRMVSSRYCDVGVVVVLVLLEEVVVSDMLCRY